MNQWWMTRCAALALCLAGCAALSDDMQRAQSAFEAARYEEVETWLAALEPDLADMDRGLRTRFYYLRGTTAFRLSKPGAARHYLVLAREELRHDPDALRPAWRDELVRMLTELGVPKALREFTVRNGLSGAGGDVGSLRNPCPAHRSGHF